MKRTIETRRLAPAAWLAAMLAVGMAAPALGDAGTSEWVGTDEARIRIVSAEDRTGEGDTVELGVEVRLAPGWKIYWRNPGDTGVPPEFDWSRSANLAGATVHWPAPERSESYGFDSLGYHDEVIYPVTVRLREPGAPLDLRLDLSYGICKEVCVPLRQEVSLSLPGGLAMETPEARRIARYRERVPEAAPAQGLVVESADFDADGRLVVAIRSDIPLADPQLIAEAPSGASLGAPERDLDEDGRHVRFRFAGEGVAGRDELAGRTVRLTFVDRDRAVETARLLP
ncbi:protein-disulfide reductase DsbD domain-containing protein [Oceanibacterium hippocampi]|uniref:Thiol:disulfide interchange protein DsbD N-terminal domain-containing protein n=1 Tax=Oceanibacterium hippocampi TaxID=745714 RepID=A0A1Y5S9Y8_9PROT|nr:protein-disulfide reductase DsbD domain-containing protein [Oceanibacterium hippocampi]SLN33377.1 hypothetical protein OCH7691_01286 [Oceanibacterium hippocampi]